LASPLALFFSAVVAARAAAADCLAFDWGRKDDVETEVFAFEDDDDDVAVEAGDDFLLAPHRRSFSNAARPRSF
jgi:hypothetical protein